MIGEETAVQPHTLLLQNADGDINTGLAKHLNTSALNLGKRINTSYYNTANTLTDNQLSTWGCLAIMGTRLQTDIDSRITQQNLILWSY